MYMYMHMYMYTGVDPHLTLFKGEEVAQRDVVAAEWDEPTAGAGG